MWWHQWGVHGFFMPWMVFVPIMIVICFLMFRSGGMCEHRFDAKDDALDIARKRFARGEISEAEFLKIKETLKQTSS